MKTGVTIAIVAILFVGFVFVWVSLAAQGVIPSIQAPLEHVNKWATFVVLVVLTAILWVVFTRTKKTGE